jgi:molybdate transport system ATP-binding protein
MIDARLVKRLHGGRDSAPFTLEVHIRAPAGITALFGPSGAGKTLILDCIAGFVAPDCGRILLDDQIVFDAQAHVNVPPRRRRCGYVFQNYALFPHMTLRENLMFAAARWRGIERRRRAGEMLERFHLTDVAGRRPHELSGGQKQRGSIARALIGEPRVLLLDEPARGLDPPLRAELYSIVSEVRAEFGTPVLLVTHNVRECLDLADEMVVLRDGRVVQSGIPADVCEHPANLDVARLLGIYNVVAAEIRSLDPSRDSSVLRIGDADITGEYYPGHLKGDRVHVLVPPQRLRARPKNGKPKPNEIAATLVRGIDTPYYMHLEFANDLRIEARPGDIVPDVHNKEYWIEFPVRGLRIL